MLDIAVAYNRFSFIGNEFLTWIWYLIESDPDKITDSQNHLIPLTIGNHIVLENKGKEDKMEVISIKGDDADLKEGKLALKKGAVVTELNLAFAENELAYQFNIKGESLHLTGLKPPETGKVEKKEELDGAILEKYFLYGRVCDVVDALFKRFILLRLSESWNKESLYKIKAWISG